MKHLLTILIAVALYAPHVAKLLAYADCSIVALTNADPRLCDCNRILDADDIPLSPDQPNKQREITLKADWKYLGETVYCVARLNQPDLHLPTPVTQQFVARLLDGSVFHPPRA